MAALSTSSIVDSLCMLSTALNPNNPEDNIPGYLLGYLPIFLLPWIVIPRLKDLNEIQKQGLAKWATVVFSIWAVVVATQYIWGWSLQHPGGGVDYRPKGFFSHPLTLAYTALLLWPILLNRLLNNIKDKYTWIMSLAIFTILILVQSRASQAIAYLIAIAMVFRRLSGPARWKVAIAFVVGTGAVFATNNPVSRGFEALFSYSDRFSTYPDDRLAFLGCPLADDQRAARDRSWHAPAFALPRTLL